MTEQQIRHDRGSIFVERSGDGQRVGLDINAGRTTVQLSLTHQQAIALITALAQALTPSQRDSATITE